LLKAAHLWATMDIFIFGDGSQQVDSLRNVQNYFYISLNYAILKPVDSKID